MTGARSGTAHHAPGAVRVLVGAVAVVTIVGCSISLLNALLAVRLHAAGFSGRAIGLNSAAGGLATLLCAPSIPRVARRIGVARLLLAALLGGGATIILFTTTHAYAAWLILRFVEGACVTVMFVLSEFWITSWSPAGRGGVVIGCYVTSLAAGFALGPLILAVTGTADDRAFYIAGLLFAVSALPLAANARHAPPIEDERRAGILRFIRDAPVPTMAALLHGAIEVAALTFLPVYALSAGANLGRAALFVSLFIIGGSAFQLPIGALADRCDRTLLLAGAAAGGLCGAVGLALLGLSHAAGFACLLLLWGGMVGALYPIGLGELGRRYAGADLACANAAFIMCYALGMLAGPPLVGAGLDLYPPSGLFWAMAVMICPFLATVGLHLRRRHTPRDHLRDRTGLS